MSGGSYDYAYGKIDEVIRAIKDDYKSNQECIRSENYDLNVGDQDLKPIAPQIKNVVSLLKDVSKLVYDLEWYTSGDTGQDDFLKAYNKFMKKWCKDDLSKSLMKDKKFMKQIKQARKELRDGKYNE